MTDERYLVRINPDNSHELLPWPEDPVRGLYDALGGFLEIVRFRPRRAFAVALGDALMEQLVLAVDDEGVLKSLPRNGVATWICAYPGTLFGPALVLRVGPNDEEELDFLPLTEDQAELISALLELSGYSRRK